MKRTLLLELIINTALIVWVVLMIGMITNFSYEPISYWTPELPNPCGSIWYNYSSYALMVGMSTILIFGRYALIGIWYTFFHNVYHKIFKLISPGDFDELA